MIDLLAMLGKMGMPAGFDISSIVGPKSETIAAPGGWDATVKPQATPMQQFGQDMLKPSPGPVPQAPAPMQAPQQARQAPDMSALLQAINNRQKLGV
jgi:hypothetical protein